LIVDPVIGVPQEISHPAQTFLIQPWRDRLSVRSQTKRRLTQNLHPALNS
jgi:hypothetical protein